jgi:hypothetical protein
MIMDMNKLNEYRTVPKEITIPTLWRRFGARNSAETPACCAATSPAVRGEYHDCDIRSQTMPGDKVSRRH